MRRLLLTYLHATSFVRDDIALLGEHYDVRCFPFEAPEAEGGVGRALAIARLAQAQWAWLQREAPAADVILSWFADYHAALPVWMGRRLGTPVTLLLGGFDCNWLPELNYGVFDSRWRAPLARFALRHADLLLPVSASLIESENRYATWPEVRRQGVRAHVPGLATPYTVVPTGYDPDAWPMGPAERGQTVCTVAFLDNERTLRIKGIDLLIAAARRLPDVTFTVVGVADAFRSEVERLYHPPTNVYLVPPRHRAALAEVYGAASVYAQLSRSEGLPSVLCEAMLCGCVPVVSAVGAMPEVANSVGEVVEAPTLDRIAEAISRALAGAEAHRTEARTRIAVGYDREQRRTDLMAALRRLTEQTA